MSAETASKQRREHPELSASEYAIAQDTIDRATHRVRDGASLIYVRELPGGQTSGHVLVEGMRARLRDSRDVEGRPFAPNKPATLAKKTARARWSIPA